MDIKCIKGIKIIAIIIIEIKTPLTLMSTVFSRIFLYIFWSFAIMKTFATAWCSFIAIITKCIWTVSHQSCDVCMLAVTD